MDKKPLRPKQERFIEEYLKDLNAIQAAIRAGYSAKTASAIGEENLRKPEISAAVSEARAKRSKETKIEAAWVLRRLRAEARNRGPGATPSARVKALEILCRHLGLFADETVNLNLRGQLEVKPVEELTDDELARIAAKGQT